MKACLSPFLLLAIAAAVLPAHGLRFVTFGSSQGDLSQPLPPKTFSTVVQRIALTNPRPEFWIFLGNAFHGYTADSVDLPKRWADWKERIKPIRNIPGYLVIGNQESNISSQIDGAHFFKAEWPSLPQNGPEGLRGTVYSFDAGNTHFVILNTEVYNNFSRVSPEQMAWLEEDLKNSRSTHLLVFGHEEAFPPVVRNQRSLEDNPAARDSLWEILYRNGVEAYVCGHLHTYDRGLFNRALAGDFKEVVQIVCGTSGAALDLWAGTPFYHYLVWDIEGSRIKITAYDQEGVVRDSFPIYPRARGRSFKAPVTYPIAYEVQIPQQAPLGTVHVTLVLRDKGGNLLRVLQETEEEPGPKVYSWDGLDRLGFPVASGSYFVEVSVAGKSKTYRIEVGGARGPTRPEVHPGTAPPLTISGIRRATISYEVPKLQGGGDKTRVALLIMDASGSPMRKLIDGDQVPGKHSVSWDGLDELGNALPSGFYDYELRAGEKVIRKKVELK